MTQGARRPHQRADPRLRFPCPYRTTQSRAGIGRQDLISLVAFHPNHRDYHADSIILPATAIPPIKIRSIEAAPLFGESPKGGWSAEIKPEDSIHAIIAVHTDAGITGYGSAFTDGRLVQAGLQGARAALCWGECARARARHRETASEHVLDGQGRNAHPHYQRDRHRSLGHLGQGHRHAGRTPAWRHLPSRASSPTALF